MTRKLKTEFQVIILFVFGATAPSGPGAPSFMRFLDHNNASHSVGLLWTSDQLVAETPT